jgi:glycine cleavage system protein P-like pyridoxal-binding family
MSCSELACLQTRRGGRGVFAGRLPFRAQRSEHGTEAVQASAIPHGNHGDNLRRAAQ